MLGPEEQKELQSHYSDASRAVTLLGVLIIGVAIFFFCGEQTRERFDPVSMGLFGALMCAVGLYLRELGEKLEES